MVNNKGKWSLSIFLFASLIFLFLLNSAPLTYGQFPPSNPGAPVFGPAPFPGSYAPPQSGGFFPPTGAPYGVPYQNQGPVFMPPAGQYGVPFQNQGPVFMPPAGQYGIPYQNQGPVFMPPAGQYGVPYQNQGPVFMPPAGQYGIPFQNQGPVFMPPAGQYGIPTQTPVYNIPPSAPYGPVNTYMPFPNIPISSDDSSSSNTYPIYNTSYNPGVFPNPSFYGPVTNIYSPQPVPQAFPGISPYGPSPAPGFIDPRVGFSNAFPNPYAVPYGNMAPLPGAFPQQGYPGLPYPGYTPYQQFNPWGLNPQWNQFNTWQPWGPGTNYSNYNFPYNPNYYPDYDTGDNDNTGNNTSTDDIPDVKGHWAGTWEAWLTDPNEGVITDPNTDQILTTISGDIHFHITQQLSTGAVLGTVEIKGWNVDPPPANWPGDWTGESDKIQLTGWIDLSSRYLKASYYYYVGKEDSGDFDVNEDLANLKGQYIWNFNSNQLKITDSGISGQFSIMGYEYYVTGVFSTAKYQPQ